MATIYLWKPDLSYGIKRVGHISLLVKNGVYLSFYPQKALVKKIQALFGVESDTRTFEEDVEYEGGKPDDQIEIPEEFVDEGKIEQFWKEQKKSYYSFLWNNCATTVKQAVVLGCKFWVTGLYAADPQYVFTQIRGGLEWSKGNVYKMN